MTALTDINPPRINIGFSRLSRLSQDEPVFTAAALIIALTMIPTLSAMAIDTRLFQLESPWAKPFKFQVALAVYLLTLAVYARWLPEGMTARRSYRLFAWAVVGAIAAELLWISGAAAFATGSHFNVSTPLMATLYSAMGFFAVLLTSASTVYGVAIWRNRASGLPDPMRVALGLGLVLTLPLTLVVAGYLSQNGGHFVGTPVTQGALPLMGWSTEVGDLRVSHFLATHALHIVPLAALLVGASVRLAWLIAGAFTLAVATTFVQAMLGLPLIAL